MTVIRPNSISGITSITAQANEINVFKHDGVLAGLQLNGVNHHTSSGVSTFHTLNVLGNVSVGGTLTYEDVTNVDSVGVITARDDINIVSDAKKLNIGAGADLQLHHTSGHSYIDDAGSGNLRLRSGTLEITNLASNKTSAVFSSGSGQTLNFNNNTKFVTTNTGVVVTGICTATSFSGDGSNLTGLSGVSVANQADNRLITATGTTDALNGEANLTFETSTSGGTLTVAGTSEYQIKLKDTNSSGNAAETALAFTDSGDTIQGFVGFNYWGDGNLDIQNNNSGANVCINTGGGNERLSIDSVGRVFFTNNTGSGASRVGGRIELSNNNPETWITINESSDSGTGPAFYINRTRGSNVASPTPVENGNYIGSIHFGSYDTNSYEKGASIQVKADGQTWSDGDCPARLAFYTTPDGDTNPREWMRISNDGSISFARGGNNQDPSHNPTVLNGKHRYSFDYSIDDSSIPYRGMRVFGSYGLGGGSTDYSYAALFDGGKTHNNCQNQYITFNQITQQLVANTHGIYCQNSSSYSTSYCYEGKMMKNLGAYTNSYTYHSNIVTTNSGGSAYHFRGADNDTTKVLILQNGDLDNANNSYTGLSDIKLKENIVDAGSQWDDIKNLKVRKFNFKAETGHETHTQIGLIAQETEPVSAGLVYEENDITVDESTGEGTVTGTTKHIKYSVLYMKAVKALQEAMTRIETLEAKVAALEGS